MNAIYSAFTHYFYTQDEVVGIPEKIPPSPDGQAFADLQKDSGIKSYFDGSSLFGAEHRTEWDALLDFNSGYYQTDAGLDWPIQDLLNKKRTTTSNDTSTSI